MMLGGDAGEVHREGEHLQIEHQLDVLFPGIGHAQRGGEEFAVLGDGVVALNRLDAAIEGAHFLEVAVHARGVGGAEPALEAGGRG